MLQALQQNIRMFHILFILVVILGVLFPDQLIGTVADFIRIFSFHLDWFILLVCTGFLLFSLYLAFGKYGNIRLGKQDSKPEFSTMSWICMLFSAGLGSGLVFYGVAEPLFHLNAPPPYPEGQDLSQEIMVKKSLMITYLNWGIHHWAIYTVTAVTIAYFSFRKDQLILADTPLRYLFPKEYNLEVFYHSMNFIAIVAIALGIVASLGQGILQLLSGLKEVGISFEDRDTAILLILFVLAFSYIGSALTGVSKGIKILSNINIFVCVLLMIYVLFSGPFHYIMGLFVTTLGEYMVTLLPMGLELYSTPSQEGASWVHNWTITYYLWCIAWGPFVGTFLARISRGRTIKEFMLGVLLVPTLFTILWFSTFGGAAIYMDSVLGTNLSEIALNDTQATTYAFLKQLPLSEITIVITIFLCFIFLVTSADSACFVMAMLSSKGAEDPAVAQKVFWGMILAVVTGGVLLSGDGDSFAFVRSITVAGAIPYLFIVILQSYALWKSLQNDIFHERVKS